MILRHKRNGVSSLPSSLSIPSSDAADFPLGALVHFRGREWVVQSIDSQHPLRTLRPLVGSPLEATTVYWPFARQTMKAASVPPILADQAGDFVSGALLRDAARLAIRQGAGPLRSLGQCAVRPRPYQLVPLMMALRLNPVRLLIADDVGVGKTIEAGLIAKELLERGAAHRVAVLCPPQLCEQWQEELRTKFHIEAVIVRGSTLRQLEEALPSQSASVFSYYPHLILSIDFIKGERHREAFIAQCPDLVIVDEAHGVADPGDRGAHGQQQRHALVTRLAAQANRHLILLTATPHSGIQDAFASLMGLLDPDLATLLRGDAELTDAARARLARHLVQRRRGDVKRWLGDDTPFPSRDTEEVGYVLAKPYEALFHAVWAFTRDLVKEEGVSRPRQRVRYWAALALLRSVMSSPAAALEALSRREAATENAHWDDVTIDMFRRREILDVAAEETQIDWVPGEAIGDGIQDWDAGRRRLATLRQQAERLLATGQDVKLTRLVETVTRLMQDGYHPIVFCRFVATAHYVADQLTHALHSRWPGLMVVPVTGEMPDEERARRVADLTQYPERIVVATDCLSEGIDLQSGFDAVIHYDLPWNPNRLEQREGRVDRYGQRRSVVKTVLLYGQNNPIDAAVLHVLIRKARAIYQSLGITVPVPMDSDAVIQALMQYFFQTGSTVTQMHFDFPDEPTARTLHLQWDRAVEREKESRSRFAHHALSPEAVAAVWQHTEEGLGSPTVVSRFLERALTRWGYPVERDGERLRLRASDLPEDLQKPAADGWVVVTCDPHQVSPVAGVLDRTHPWVAAWAQRVLATALSGSEPDRVARTGAIITEAVSVRTVIAIARLRYRIREGVAPEQFAEEVVVTGYQRGHAANWHANHGDWIYWAENSMPVQNFESQREREDAVRWGLDVLARAETREAAEVMAQTRADQLTATYRRLRPGLGGPRDITITPYPPDWLGLYVLVPGGTD